MIVAASRKFDRRVQMGNQRRSYPYVREAMQRLHEGVIGKVFSAKTWYNNRRGFRKTTDVSHASAQADHAHPEKIACLVGGPDRARSKGQGACHGRALDKFSTVRKV